MVAADVVHVGYKSGANPIYHPQRKLISRYHSACTSYSMRYRTRLRNKYSQWLAGSFHVYSSHVLLTYFKHLIIRARIDI